jgi:hypothetical protein
MPDPAACPSQPTPTASTVSTPSTPSAPSTPTIEGLHHGKPDHRCPSVAFPAIPSPAHPKESMWPAMPTHQGNIGLGGARLPHGPVETCICTLSPRPTLRPGAPTIAKALIPASQLGWHHFHPPAASQCRVLPTITPLPCPMEIAPSTSGDSRVQSAISRQTYSPHAYPPP